MDLTSLLSSQWDSLLPGLPAGVDLTRLARETGALRRTRRIRDGETLLRLALWYGPGGLSLRGAAGLATGTQVAALSDVALYKRLAGAADFLEALVAAVLAAQRQEQSIPSPGSRDLVLVDATVVSGPGSAGGGESGDWRLHSRYSLARGGFTGFELTDGRGAESLERHAFAPGEIVIADRVHARGQGLRHVLAASADYIVRAGWRSLALRDEAGEPFDLLARLAGLRVGEVVDLAAMVALEGAMLPVRLVVEVREEEVAQAVAGRVARKAQKNQRAGDPRSLEAARYVILATSLDAGDYPAATILAWYRLRWQIELAFKRLKSLLHIDWLPAKTPDLARTWLNAHLLIALIIDDMTRQLLDSPPCA